MPAWNDVLVLAPMEITEAADEAFWRAMKEYEGLKSRRVFPRKTLPAFLWAAMMQALPQDELAEQMGDFCRAVLAGNRPRTGEPFDTIYRQLRRATSSAGVDAAARPDEGSVGPSRLSAPSNPPGRKEGAFMVPGPRNADGSFKAVPAGSPDAVTDAAGMGARELAKRCEDLAAVVGARFVSDAEKMARYARAKVVRTEPTPAPDVPGVVERLRGYVHSCPPGYEKSHHADMVRAAEALEALQAEVARLTKEADGDFVAAAVRVMREHPGFDARDYEFDGISADDFEQFFSEDMKEAWHCAEAAEARATAAEAERDALKAEVERMKERNAEHEARFDAESSRADHYKAEVERKDKALREAGEAIAEYFRYLNGGEMRGSYDGKPEREGLRKAGYAVSRALSPAKAGG